MINCGKVRVVEIIQSQGGEEGEDLRELSLILPTASLITG